GLSLTTSRSAAYSAGAITGGRPVLAIALLLCNQCSRIVFCFFYTLLATQKKVTAPPGAHPGLRPQRKHAA
ncbi:hypothetical protein, partial [Acidovorax sp.]|uniref:hypothetical protein n=1 Tax=Acidovorax sp. TaxID=1872122 RepID=UPI00391F80E7